jgi:DNA-binding NtrC family response regulator
MSRDAQSQQASISSAHVTGYSIDCVFLTCFDSRFHFFAELLRQGGIRMHRAETLDQADFFLTVTDATVVLSDVVFLDGSWRDAIKILSYLHPLVVTAVIADEEDRQYLSEAADSGAFAVLWRPFEFAQLRRLIRIAGEAAQQRSSLDVRHGP